MVYEKGLFGAFYIPGKHKNVVVVVVEKKKRNYAAAAALICEWATNAFK